MFLFYVGYGLCVGFLGKLILVFVYKYILVRIGVTGI